MADGGFEGLRWRLRARGRLAPLRALASTNFGIGGAFVAAAALIPAEGVGQIGELLRGAHDAEQLAELGDRQIVVLEALGDGGERHQSVEQQRQVPPRERQVVLDRFLHTLDQRIESTLVERGNTLGAAWRAGLAGARVGGSWARHGHAERDGVGRGAVQEAGDVQRVGDGDGDGAGTAAARALPVAAAPGAQQPPSSSARRARALASLIGDSTPVGQPLKRPLERRLVINQ